MEAWVLSGQSVTPHTLSGTAPAQSCIYRETTSSVLALDNVRCRVWTTEPLQAQGTPDIVRVPCRINIPLMFEFTLDYPWYPYMITNETPFALRDSSRTMEPLQV